MRYAAVAAAVVCVGLAATVSLSASDPWHHDEARAFAEARASGRHVLVDFGAEWCAPCTRIEAILDQPAVTAELSRSFVFLRIDVTDPDPVQEALQDKYRVRTLPAVVFVASDGRELGRYGSAKPSQANLMEQIHAIVAAHPAGGRDG